jgi:hypothetical protein
MAGLILETESETITFQQDGHLLHTHNHNFTQRRSLGSWPDFETAKKAVETDLSRIKWAEPE